jgi:ABC-type nitrate/sulfonate/bicarbonate transport system substrate-binding protein
VVAKQKSIADRNQKIKEFERELTEAVNEKNGHTKNGKASIATKAPSRPRRDMIVSLMTRLVNALESGNDGEAISALDQMQVSSKADCDKVIGLCNKLIYRLKVLTK